uniref:Uncharacterized protein n=1 Tax=Triticum urartu TaxID=4572 RepID=A0A8R7JX31_TRIUA
MNCSVPKISMKRCFCSSVLLFALLCSFLF